MRDHDSFRNTVTVAVLIPMRFEMRGPRARNARPLGHRLSSNAIEAAAQDQ